MPDFWALQFVAAFIVPLISFANATSSPAVGPAKLVMQYTEKCGWTAPTFINTDLLLYRRKSTVILSYYCELNHGFSDDFGFSVNVAMKGNGGWRPNFFKYKGGGACSSTKMYLKHFFREMGKQLKAPQPYKCPLPPGKVNVTIEPEMVGLEEKMNIAVAPYGEFKITTNITYKNDVVHASCSLWTSYRKLPKPKEGADILYILLYLKCLS